MKYYYNLGINKKKYETTAHKKNKVQNSATKIWLIDSLYIIVGNGEILTITAFLPLFHMNIKFVSVLAQLITITSNHGSWNKC